jgi:HD-like signal output (HDOD) protein
MNESLAEWLNKLDQSCLPALQANIERLKQLAADENADMGQLVGVIESDPALALRLMRYINNLRRKHLNSEISTVRHGLMMLGMSHVQQISQNVTAVEDLPEDIRQRLLRHFSRSFHAAYQARDWARLTKDMVADELYLAALLRNLGEILLDLTAPQEMERVREMIHEKAMESDEAEYIVFGFNIDQLTLALAQHWRLPDLLVDSLKSENAQRNRVLNVMLATQLADYAEHGWYTRPMYELQEQIADLLLADTTSTATLVHRNAVEAAQESAQFNVPHPAITLLYPVTLSDEAEETPQPESEDTATVIDENNTDFCLLPQRHVLVRVLKQMAAADETVPLKDIIALALEGMHEGLGLNRVVFAMLTPDKGQLRARRIVGSENDPQFSRFMVDLVSHNLFVRLMEKPQSLWLNSGNRGKFFPLIPIQFHKLIRNDSFFVMSLFVKNKPIGMFYADRHTSSCELDEETYKRFKHVVAQVSHTLSQVVK